MGILRKPYEISYWEDVWDELSQSYKEQRVQTIGSNEMTAQTRAQNPKLTRKTNGEISFSFEMYYQYVDNITGQLEENPIVNVLQNESKIKLYYNSEWFDLLIKHINKNSKQHLITYQLVNQHVEELSKNGYNVTLDAQLMNNMGTAQQLGNTLLEGTDWNVESEALIQTSDEALVVFKTTQNIEARPISQTSGGVSEGELTTIEAGSIIYGFYSSCAISSEGRFQFIYVPGDITIDSERIIANTGCQYYIDGVSSWTIDNYRKIRYPSVLALSFEATGGSSNWISTKYRGRKYVYSPKKTYHKGLGRYVKEFTYSQGMETGRCYGYTQTTYVAPNIITNLVTNPSFKKTSGWRGKMMDTATEAGSNMLIDEFIGYKIGDNYIDGYSGAFMSGNDITKYTSYLKCSNIKDGGLLVNSGPYNMRKSVEGIAEGEEYIFTVDCVRVKKPDNRQTYEAVSFGANTTVRVRMANYPLDPNNIEQYKTAAEDSIVLFDSLYCDKQERIIDRDAKEHCIFTFIIKASQSVTKQQFLDNKFQLFINFSNFDNNDGQPIVLIKSLQCYKKYPLGDGYYTLETPINTNNITYQEEWKYFDASDDIETTEEDLKFLPKNIVVTPVIDSTCAKISSVNIKESNYFNGIQSIAETFQCWPQIIVQHDDNGNIGQKTIKFTTYVGQPNHVGFKYGVNNKDIQRTVDSKQIVTKLIVKNNANEFGTNGFCSIARAPGNALHDTVLYDFGYYVNQLMIDADALQEFLYVVPEGEVNGYDYTNAQGYYTKLSTINRILEDKSALLVKQAVALNQAQADYTYNEAGYEGALVELETAKDKFYDYCGLSFEELAKAKDETKNKILNSVTAKGQVAQIVEIGQTLQNYITEKEKAKVALDQLTTIYNEINADFETATDNKEALNKAFYVVYSRFIQEGAWIDESYIDDSLYYTDAQSVLYNSARPKVSYTINVLSLAGLPGYELFDFRIGDQTFIEDVEFFGYNNDGSPHRESITVTETVENLDDPIKNSIKVQNYENQFQDLFQRITAAVQQVQYSEGSYKKATALVEADEKRKVEFLSDALNSVETAISNAGEQSVVIDNQGITITDKSDESKALRMISGAILLKQSQEDGRESWRTGLTADGISANLITAGEINTGQIQIMNGDDPTFKWDSHGITAYHFTNSGNNNYLSGIDTSRGVRFDRFGVYGYSGIDGETWKPTEEADIDAHSAFSLTWGGLKVSQFSRDETNNQLETVAELRIGNSAAVDPNDPNPAFLKVTKHDKEGNSYDSWWITANGDIQWGQSQSPTQVLYNTNNSSKPENNHRHDDFPEVRTLKEGSTTEYIHDGWHRVKSEEDIYASYTYDGGWTWTPPIQLQGINGASPYILSLSNEYDVWTKTSAGAWLSKSTTIRVQGFYGNIEQELKIEDIEVVGLDGNIVDYEIKKDTDSKFVIVTISLIDTKDLTTKLEGNVIWKTAGLTIAKKITIQPITSLVDYDLVLSDTTIQANSLPDSVILNVLKKSENGTELLESPDKDTSIKIYCGDEECDSWSLEVNTDTEWPLALTLKSSDDGIIWDYATINLVQDGFSPYTLTLNNNYDTVAIAADGNVRSALPITVTASAYLGATLATDVAIDCMPQYTPTYVVRNAGPLDEGALPTLEGQEGDICRDATGVYFYHDGTQWESKGKGFSKLVEALQLKRGNVYEIEVGYSNSTAVARRDLWVYPLSGQLTQLTSGDSLKDTSWYKYDNMNHTLSINQYWCDVNFVFSLKKSTTILDTKTFVLKSVLSPCDYNLIVPTVINNSQTVGSQTIPLKVQQIGDGVTYIFDPIGSDLSIQILQEEAWKEITSWRDDLTYNNATTSIQLRLLQGDIVWDEETIEFVKNGNDATVTKDAVMDVLEKLDDNPKDGIYTYSYDEGQGPKTAIGINATAIKTGALAVGGTSKNNFTDAVFFAKLPTGTEEAQVYLAGWEVDDHSITTGDLGQIDSFHIISSGQTDRLSIADSGYFENWRLAIGENFGVNAAGTLFARNASISGTITGGTINIGEGFSVDIEGNVTTAGDVTLGGNIYMNGNITWADDSTPTQVVYHRGPAPTKPNDGSSYESFPSTNAEAQSGQNKGWHRTYESGDIYGSYTYNGGRTWGNPIVVAGSKGANGDSTVTEYRYYSAPEAGLPTRYPPNNEAGVGNGWEVSHGGVSEITPYIYVTHRTVVNSNYESANWSTPTLFANYSKDGVSPEIDHETVFNALTNNGQWQGLYVNPTDGNVYINATYIQGDKITADQINGNQLEITNGSFSGDVVASSFSAVQDIGTGTLIVSVDSTGIVIDQDKTWKATLSAGSLQLSNAYVGPDKLEFDVNVITRQGLTYEYAEGKTHDLVWEDLYKLVQSGGGGGGGDGYVTKDEFDALKEELQNNHQMFLEAQVAATCQTEGYETYHCTNPACTYKNSVRIDLPIVDHNTDGPIEYDYSYEDEYHHAKVEFPTCSWCEERGDQTSWVLEEHAQNTNYFDGVEQLPDNSVGNPQVQHRKKYTKCAICKSDGPVYALEDHDLKIIQLTSTHDTSHYKRESCSCGYSTEAWEGHDLTTVYELKDGTYHTAITTCKTTNEDGTIKCDYWRSEDTKHTLTRINRPADVPSQCKCTYGQCSYCKKIVRKQGAICSYTGHASHDYPTTTLDITI